MHSFKQNAFKQNGQSRLKQYSRDGHSNRHSNGHKHYTKPNRADFLKPLKARLAAAVFTAAIFASSIFTAAAASAGLSLVGASFSKAASTDLRGVVEWNLKKSKGNNTGMITFTDAPETVRISVLYTRITSSSAPPVTVTDALGYSVSTSVKESNTLSLTRHHRNSMKELGYDDLAMDVYYVKDYYGIWGLDITVDSTNNLSEVMVAISEVPDNYEELRAEYNTSPIKVLAYGLSSSRYTFEDLQNALAEEVEPENARAKPEGEDYIPVVDHTTEILEMAGLAALAIGVLIFLSFFKKRKKKKDDARNSSQRITSMNEAYRAEYEERVKRGLQKIVEKGGYEDEGAPNIIPIPYAKAKEPLSSFLDNDPETINGNNALTLSSIDERIDKRPKAGYSNTEAPTGRNFLSDAIETRYNKPSESKSSESKPVKPRATSQKVSAVIPEPASKHAFASVTPDPAAGHEVTQRPALKPEKSPIKETESTVYMPSQLIKRKSNRLDDPFKDEPLFESRLYEGRRNEIKQRAQHTAPASLNIQPSPMPSAQNSIPAWVVKRV